MFSWEEHIMNKKLIVFVVFGLFAALAFAQSITLHSVGINSSNANRQLAVPGDEITVTYSFTPSGLGDFGMIQGSAMNASNLDKIYVVWYSESNGTGSMSVANTVTNFIDDSSFTDGVVNQRSLTFTLPEAPAGRLSFKVRTSLYGLDDFWDTVLSSLTFSSGGPSGTYAYITMDTNTAPTATNVQIDNPSQTKVGQTLIGSYIFSDADSDLEGSSEYVWLRSTTTDYYGSYAPVAGATSSTYTLTSSDINRFLKFAVTPVAQTGVAEGTQVISTPSGQVMPASSIAIDASSTMLVEAAANNGSISGSILVNISNGDFAPTVSGVSVSNLPTGLSVGAITRISNSQIRVAFSGAATEHEEASSILDTSTLLVTVPAASIIDQSIDLFTPTGFKIDFANNPVTNLHVEEACYNEVTIGWNIPNGLQASTSLYAFNVHRGGVFQTQVLYAAGQTAFTYTDTGVVNGSSYTYSIVADYTGSSDDPTSLNSVGATPLSITGYAFDYDGATGDIDYNTRTISVTVPYATSLSNLVANYTTVGAATVKVNGTNQTSGVTANDFTNPVVYVLAASDGSTCSYTVSVTIAAQVFLPPELLEGTVTTSSIQALWSAVDGAYGYTLDVSTDPAFGSFVTGYGNLALSSSDTYHVINGLQADTDYYLRMRTLGESSTYSDYSGTQTVSTLATSSGSGSTEVNGSAPTSVNIGSYSDGTNNVNPSLTIDPVDFVPSSDNTVTVSLSIGSSPEGLCYMLNFDNPTIGVGTFTMSYEGLSYDPTDLGFRINGGGLVSIGADGIDTGNKTFTISIDGLNKNAKGAYQLELITNDASGQTLPVVLSSFTANIVSGSKVRISWTTQSESGVQGFYILRGTDTELSSAEIVSPLIEATNTSNTANYVYTDSEVPGPGTYHYWLQIQDMDGTATYTNSIRVDVETTEGDGNGVIQVTTLKNAYPNPFNPIINIAYDVAETGHVSIEIYNTRGQRIRTLVSEAKNPASYITQWDGKDSYGKNVSSGTYLLKMKAKTYDKTRKITLMK